VDIHAPELGCDVGGVAAAYWLFDVLFICLYLYIIIMWVFSNNIYDPLSCVYVYMCITGCDC
jgi:hypothetical protein